MTMKVEIDGTTPVRIRNSTLDKIMGVLKSSKAFDSPADFIDYAVKKTLKEES